MKEREVVVWGIGDEYLRDIGSGEYDVLKMLNGKGNFIIRESNGLAKEVEEKNEKRSQNNSVLSSAIS